ncbi:MAG: 5-oxoprolinase subunit PxpA [Saprospiraceae bacterium]
MSKILHINCDMAESYGNLKTGNDEAIMPMVDAVNIACGFHGGDPLTIQSTISQAIRLGKEIGAHPSYPDLQGFGRRNMDLSDNELEACLRYQISAIKCMTESLGSTLNHVKVHGALYNFASANSNAANIIAKVVASIDKNLVLYAPYNSAMALAAVDAGLMVKYESFADRRYDDEGQLAKRNLPLAIIGNPIDVLSQTRLLLKDQALTLNIKMIPMKSDTICVHGDHPNVLENLRIIRENIASQV